MSERIVSPRSRDDDLVVESSLRPKSLAEYIGQEKVKEDLRIFIAAAKARNEVLDHVLLYGPPGLGKTTLANIIANQMGVAIKTTSGPAIEHRGDLAAILTDLRKGDILFIDEIHRLNRAVEEILYPAMEDFALDLVTGKGAGARSIRLSLPRFTFIGATTRYALLSTPLRDRFGHTQRLDFYDSVAMAAIVDRSARILSVPIDPDATGKIGARSRGTPRVANRLLRRIRDYAQVEDSGSITVEVAERALTRLEVDELGLDEMDRRVLLAIVEKFDGGPVGLDTIAAAIGEEPDTVMDVYEPFLLQLGFINRTPRGRVATRRAYEHLAIPIPQRGPAQQAPLFQL